MVGECLDAESEEEMRRRAPCKRADQPTKSSGAQLGSHPLPPPPRIARTAVFRQFIRGREVFGRQEIQLRAISISISITAAAGGQKSQDMGRQGKKEKWETYVLPPFAPFRHDHGMHDLEAAEGVHVAVCPAGEALDQIGGFERGGGVRLVGFQQRGRGDERVVAFVVGGGGGEGG